MISRDNVLVSVIVLSYNARSVMSRVLHSVFMQDHSRIEIIIADDGSDDFSLDYLERLLLSNKNQNIEKVEIVPSESNKGTVANLWQALEVMQGDYFLIIGADDSLPQPTTISDYMKTFAARNWQPLLVTGLVEMWSEDMNTLLRVIPEGEGRAALQSEDPKKLLNALAYECVVPIVATCFHRSLIDKINAFDRAYRYYEDYPTFLRMARNGITPVYINKSMAKHAHGGVANGATDTFSPIAIGLYNDRVRMWKTEIDPYVKKLNKQSLSRNRARRQREKQTFIAMKNDSKRMRSSSSSDWSQRIRKFFYSKAIHRTTQSFKFFLLTFLAGLGIACGMGGQNVLSIGFWLVALLFMICTIWFGGLCCWRLLKKVRSLT